MTISTNQPVGTHPIETTRWRVDPARSRVEFRTPTFWGLATVKGIFDRYDGTLDMQSDPAIELAIEAAALNTNNKLRDRHLRSADFFDVENHPQVRFVSDSATLEGDALKVDGRLYAGGEQITLSLDASLRRVGDELEIEALTEVDHRQLGMTHSTLGMIRTPTELRVGARLVRDS